jgi:hypothetical protein
LTLTETLTELLAESPGATARQLVDRVAQRGHAGVTKAQVNIALYSSRQFVHDSGLPPKWRLVEVQPGGSRVASIGEPSRGGTVPEGRPRQPAAVRHLEPPDVDRDTQPDDQIASTPLIDGPTAVSAHPRTETTVGQRPFIDSMAKAELITTICDAISVPDVGIGPGSTEPKALFIRVVERLGLRIDTALSKPEIAEQIARAAGLIWLPAMDSRGTPSGGGDTVTAVGLRQVLRAVWILLGRREGEPKRSVTVDDSASESAELLSRVAPGDATTHSGGGGEGPLHAAIKAFVKSDPMAALGEPMTCLAEDLADNVIQRLGDEISFVTGDRVDLLMRDSRGAFVVIEVEPDIGPSGHIGFHQAAKYWVLVAVANGIQLSEVRRAVVARSIDPGLREHYRRLYGIEAFEVTPPSY